QGEKLPAQIHCYKVAPRSQHPAEILSESFIDPQQITSHRLFEIAGRQTVRSAVFSIPGMNELMRYECGVREVRCEIRKIVFPGPIFARFVVLDAEVRELIAKRHQKVVLAVVGCAEQRSCFSN